ncbi:hypothetical protein, partial [Staphylococcus simulans]
MKGYDKPIEQQTYGKETKKTQHTPFDREGELSFCENLFKLECWPNTCETGAFKIITLPTKGKRRDWVGSGEEKKKTIR